MKSSSKRAPMQYIIVKVNLNRQEIEQEAQANTHARNERAESHWKTMTFLTPLRKSGLTLPCKYLNCLSSTTYIG
jgi:hypothetical protein